MSKPKNKLNTKNKNRLCRQHHHGRHRRPGRRRCRYCRRQFVYHTLALYVVYEQILRLHVCTLPM